ncbi:MAG: MarC family protein [Saprospiraceae bacterium]|nr:MarC family protein [Saprospiraceae bacterium]
MKAIISSTLILFSVIDIPGSIPVMLTLRKQGVRINPLSATLISGLIMGLFLIFGTRILAIFGIESSSFAVAGGFVILLIGLELLLGITIFKDLALPGSNGNIVPIAFPLVAGAGTLTTILTLKAQFDLLSIALAIGFNLIIVFITLHSLEWLSQKVTDELLSSLRKIFGILLLAIGIQIIKSNF